MKTARRKTRLYLPSFIGGPLALALAVVCLTLVTGSLALADTYNLYPAPSTQTINGAIFTTIEADPTGTGVFDPFLRIQHNGTEQGYNEDYHLGYTNYFNEKTDPHTHSVAISSLAPTTYNGSGSYYQFTLDMAQNNSATGRYLSLDSLQLYQSSTANPNCGTNLSCLGTLVYNLDTATVDNTLNLDDVNAGNGQADVYVYVPTSGFHGTSGYLILYSQFGNPYASNSSFEEWAWAATTQPTPEPASLFLFGTGLASIAGMIRKRRK